MATSNETFRPESLVVWGYEDMRDRVIAVLREALEGNLFVQFGADPIQVDVQATVVVNGAAPNRSLDLSVTDGRGVVPRVHEHNQLLLYDNADTYKGATIYQDVPYEDDAAATFHVGLRWNEHPLESRLSDGGVYELVRWRDGIGERGNPDSVTDNGDGTVTLNINTLIGGTAWSNNGKTRQVTAWLSTPETGYEPDTDTGEGIFHGSADSDGADVTIAVGHQFGQTGTPSTDPNDYEVIVHGMSIWDSAVRNLLTYTEGSPTFKPYVFIASVLAAAVDTSSATVSPSLGSDYLDLLQLANDLYVTPSLDHDGAANLSEPLELVVNRVLFQAGLRRFPMGRAGLWMGSHEDVEDWSTAVSVAPNSGDVRITNLVEPTWADGHWIMTCLAAAPGGIPGLLALGEGRYMKACHKSAAGFTWDPYDYTPLATGDHWVVFEAIEDADGLGHGVQLQTYQSGSWTTFQDVLDTGFLPLLKYNVSSLGPPVVLSYTVNTDLFNLASWRGFNPLGRAEGDGLEMPVQDVIRDENALVGTRVRILETLRNTSGVPKLERRCYGTADTYDPASLAFLFDRVTQFLTTTVLGRSMALNVWQYFGIEGETTPTADNGLALRFGGDADDDHVLVQGEHTTLGRVLAIVWGWNSPESGYEHLRIERANGAQQSQTNGVYPRVLVEDLQLFGAKRFDKPVKLIPLVNSVPYTFTWTPGSSFAYWQTPAFGGTHTIVFEVDNFNEGNNTDGGWDLVDVEVITELDSLADSWTVNVYAQDFEESGTINGTFTTLMTKATFGNGSTAKLRNGINGGSPVDMSKDGNTAQRRLFVEVSFNSAGTSFGRLLGIFGVWSRDQL